MARPRGAVPHSNVERYHRKTAHSTPQIGGAYAAAMPIHLRVSPGDYATNVLCPGDPTRATYIAETFFDEGWRCVNSERGMLGYTGTFQGSPISVQTTGMGCPSAGIVFEELAMLGVQRIVRVGTCGGLQPQTKMGDSVIAVSASADDGTALRYAAMSGFAPTASWNLVATAAGLVSDASARTVHVGPIVTSGLFYDPDPEAFNRWRRLGHLGVEMEAAMLYTIAAVKGMEALAMMVVSDVIGETEQVERISDEDLKAGVDQLLSIACHVAVS